MSTGPGWAIRRNGSCLLTTEVDCGETMNPYRACCPSSTTCPTQYNTACCPANVNCTLALVKTPSCANSSWSMFDNGGYFCCETGQIGYNIDDSDGCSLSGKILPDHAAPLSVVDQTSSSTTLVQSTNHTLTPSPPPSPSPHTSNIAPGAGPGGTIAGAVVGGVAGITIIAGLIWWFCMRKKIGSSESVNKVSQHIHESSKGRNQYREHPSMLIIQRPAEIDGNPKSELIEATDRTEGRSEML